MAESLAGLRQDKIRIAGAGICQPSGHRRAGERGIWHSLLQAGRPDLVDVAWGRSSGGYQGKKRRRRGSGDVRSVWEKIASLPPSEIYQPKPNARNAQWYATLYLACPFHPVRPIKTPKSAVFDPVLVSQNAFAGCRKVILIQVAQSRICPSIRPWISETCSRTLSPYARLVVAPAHRYYRAHSGGVYG